MKIKYQLFDPAHGPHLDEFFDSVEDAERARDELIAEYLADDMEFLRIALDQKLMREEFTRVGDLNQDPEPPVEDSMQCGELISDNLTDDTGFLETARRQNDRDYKWLIELEKNPERLEEIARERAKEFVTIKMIDYKKFN